MKMTEIYSNATPFHQYSVMIWRFNFFPWWGIRSNRQQNSSKGAGLFTRNVTVTISVNDDRNFDGQNGI